MTQRASYTIERLLVPVDATDLQDLSQLLVGAIEAGTAISFLSSLSVEASLIWW